MRTSRISRDTSRILAASRAQRTLRQTRSSANITTQNTAPARIDSGSDKDENAVSDSDFSSAPADSGSDGEEQPIKKRKRGNATPVKIKYEKQEVSMTAIASPKTDAKVKKESKPKKARRVPAKKVVAADGSVKVEPPPNWEEIYALTREMRNENPAPVDTMGCESLTDRQQSPRDQRFQTLVALMLSSQTKDTVTAVAMRGMQERMPGVSASYTCCLTWTYNYRALISNLF